MSTPPLARTLGKVRLFCTLMTPEVQTEESRSVPPVDFVTACDFERLPQALALFESLIENFSGELTLWIWSEDAETQSAIHKLNDSRLRVLSALKLTPREEKIFWEIPRNHRYWYAAAASILTLMRQDCRNIIVYVDSDVWMLKPIDGLLGSFSQSNASVLMTPHDFDERYDKTGLVGEFCVQFLPFKPSPTSLRIAEDWLRDCLKLPGHYEIEGDYGDQKILDSWEGRYGQAVTRSQPPGAFMGPWNARIFPLKCAISYHFQGLRLLSSRRAFIGEYLLPKSFAKDLYLPYLDACSLQCQRVKALASGERITFTGGPRGLNALRSRIRLLRRSGRRHIANPFMRVKSRGRRSRVSLNQN